MVESNHQFALYTGKLVLQGVLQQELYENFLAFSAAMCIIVSPKLVLNYCAQATEML